VEGEDEGWENGEDDAIGEVLEEGRKRRKEMLHRVWIPSSWVCAQCDA